MCERERERGQVCVCVREREKKKVCVCVRERERERVMSASSMVADITIANDSGTCNSGLSFGVRF